MTPDRELVVALGERCFANDTVVVVLCDCHGNGGVVVWVPGLVGELESGKVRFCVVLCDCYAVNGAARG